MQITALNNLVGVPLLQRVRTQWLLTKAGEELYQSALEVLGAIERLEQSLVDATSQHSGHVTIASTRVVGEIILAPVVAGFVQAYPHIRLDIQLFGCKEIEQMLEKHAIDVALVADPFFIEHFAAYPIAEDELVAVLPANHPLASDAAVSITTLVKEPLVCLSESSSVWALLRERLGDLCDDFQVEHFLNSTPALLSLVEAGVGCSIMPRKIAERGARWAEVVYKPIVDCDLHRRLLVAVSTQVVGEPIEVFVSWLRDAGVTRDVRDCLVLPHASERTFHATTSAIAK